MAGGLGFEELAQTIRNLGLDQVNNAYTGIKTMEDVKTSEVNRGIKQIELDDKKRVAEFLDSPAPLNQVFGAMTANASPAERVNAATKVPEVLQLMGWKIDEADPNAPITKTDGKPVTWRDVHFGSNIISAYYVSNADPVTEVQRNIERSKDNLQKALPNINLGSGTDIDSKVLKTLNANARSGKLSEPAKEAFAQYVRDRKEFDAVTTNPKGAYKSYVDGLTKLKGIIKTSGGDDSILDARLQKAMGDMEKIPVTPAIARSSGLTPGLLLSPQQNVVLGEKMIGLQGDMIRAKSTERAHAAGIRQENKVSFNNKLMEILNAIPASVSKEVNEGVQTMNLPADQKTNLIQKETQRRITDFYQGLYDTFDEKRLNELGVQVPEFVDKSTAAFRAKQRPIAEGLVKYASSLQEQDPMRLQIANTLKTIEQTRRSGNESGAEAQLTELVKQVEQIKQAKTQNKTEAIKNGAKGLDKGTFNMRFNMGVFN